MTILVIVSNVCIATCGGMLAGFLGLSVGRGAISFHSHFMGAARDLARSAGGAAGAAAAWPFEWLVDQLDQRTAAAAEWRKQRQIWRREFRGTMSWREFRRQLEGKTELDELARAMAIFGLTEPFSRTELNSRFRHVVQAVHPDRGGSEYLAHMAVEARKTILAKKGWRR